MVESVTNALSTFATWATSIGVIFATLSAVCKPLRNFFKWLFKKLFGSSENEILKELKQFENRIDKKIEIVAEKVDENERGRLRQVIFDYGNKARKHEKIDGEHFRYLQDCYNKYHNELNGNSIAMDEYLFVEKYYNESGWEKD